MRTDVKIQPAKQADLNKIIRLLSKEQLPVIDMGDEAVHLFVAMIRDEIISVIGLEKYKNKGLLRSLAVEEAYKNQKTGEAMIKYLFEYCDKEKITALYLLTTTAENYFTRFGFQQTDRFKVPAVIRQTREFKDLCPASAVVMVRLMENQ